MKYSIMLAVNIMLLLSLWIGLNNRGLWIIGEEIFITGKVIVNIDIDDKTYRYEYTTSLKTEEDFFIIKDDMIKIYSNKNWRVGDTINIGAIWGKIKDKEN